MMKVAGENGINTNHADQNQRVNSSGLAITTVENNINDFLSSAISLGKPSKNLIKVAGESVINTSHANQSQMINRGGLATATAENNINDFLSSAISLAKSSKSLTKVAGERGINTSHATQSQMINRGGLATATAEKGVKNADIFLDRTSSAKQLKALSRKLTIRAVTPLITGSKTARPNAIGQKKIQQTPDFSQSVTCELERKLPESCNIKKMAACLQQAKEYIGKGWQPDGEILDHDPFAMAAAINLENKKTANLNLILCDSVEEAIAAINKEQAPSHKRLIFRDRDIGQHYIFADVSLEPGKPASIFLLESTNLANPIGYKLYHKFAGQLKEANQSSPLFSPNMVIFNMGVQQSPADCLIFCFSFASEAHKYNELFAAWHKNLHAGLFELEKIDPEMEKMIFKKSRDNFYAYKPEILPADFFKHSQSRRVIDKRLGSLLANENTDREMLEQKLKGREQRCQRVNQQEKFEYLTSIEHERSNIMAETLNAMVAAENSGAAIA